MLMLLSVGPVLWKRLLTPAAGKALTDRIGMVVRHPEQRALRGDADGVTGSSPNRPCGNRVRPRLR
jgi:hypothetical protein